MKQCVCIQDFDRYHVFRKDEKYYFENVGYYKVYVEKCKYIIFDDFHLFFKDKVEIRKQKLEKLK